MPMVSRLTNAQRMLAGGGTNAGDVRSGGGACGGSSGGGGSVGPIKGDPGAVLGNGATSVGWGDEDGAGDAGGGEYGVAYHDSYVLGRPGVERFERDVRDREHQWFVDMFGGGIDPLESRGHGGSPFGGDLGSGLPGWEIFEGVFGDGLGLGIGRGPEDAFHSLEQGLGLDDGLYGAIVEAGVWGPGRTPFKVA